MLPTDQLYREQLALLYQDPRALIPRVVVGLALMESGEISGLSLLKSCLEVSLKVGRPVISLWTLALLKKYAPLLDTEPWIERFLSLYAATLNENSPLKTPPYTSQESVEGERPDLLTNLKALEGYELQTQTSAVALDLSVFEDDRDIIIGELPLYSAFKPEILSQLIKVLELKSFAEGDLLIEEGEEADGVYLLCYGVVDITRRTQEGETLNLATLHSGDLVGEMGLITNSPRVATAIARDEVWALVLPSSAYALMSESQEEVRAALSHLVGGRMLHNLTLFSPVFQAIPREAHPEILSKFKSLVVQPGQILLQQGQSGRGLFLILDGLVRVTQLGSIEPKWLREGDIFGEISLVYDSPVSATCTAVRRSLLFTLSPKRFTTLIESYPEVRHTLTELSLFRNLDALYTLT
jgi:cAMP-dependent protein kinase regulator